MKMVLYHLIRKLFYLNVKVYSRVNDLHCKRFRMKVDHRSFDPSGYFFFKLGKLFISCLAFCKALNLLDIFLKGGQARKHCFFSYMCPKGEQTRKKPIFPCHVSQRFVNHGTLFPSYAFWFVNQSIVLSFVSHVKFHCRNKK